MISINTSFSSKWQGFGYLKVIIYYVSCEAAVQTAAVCLELLYCGLPNLPRNKEYQHGEYTTLKVSRCWLGENIIKFTVCVSGHAWHSAWRIAGRVGAYRTSKETKAVAKAREENSSLAIWFCWLVKICVSTFSTCRVHVNVQYWVTCRWEQRIAVLMFFFQCYPN